MMMGVSTANLLVGMTRNDVKVNIRGIATCNSSKQLLQTCLFGRKLIQFCSNTASIAMDPVLSALDVCGLSLDGQRYFSTGPV